MKIKSSTINLFFVPFTVLFLFVIAALIFMPLSVIAQAEENAAGVIQVTDFENREITLSQPPQHIGALLGNSFPQILFLDGADKVAAMMALGYTKWFDEIYPEVASMNIAKLNNARDPNIEELAELGIDVVFYWSGLPDQVRKMNEIGIPVIASNPSGIDFETAQEFRDLVAREMNLYAVVLGQQAEEKAARWLAYLDEKIAYVSERVNTLTPDQIKKVYYIRKAEDGLQCFAKSSYPLILVNIAGGELVSKELDTNLSGFTDVTMEQIIEWDPEVIFMGWMNTTDAVLKDERWSVVSAVKNGQVYLTPTSTSALFWDYAAEAPLDLLYIAKTLHPDLFTDLDLIQEIQNFYKVFADYDLSAEGAQRMLNRLPPL